MSLLLLPLSMDLLHGSSMTIFQTVLPVTLYTLSLGLPGSTQRLKLHPWCVHYSRNRISHSPIVDSRDVRNLDQIIHNPAQIPTKHHHNGWANGIGSYKIFVGTKLNEIIEFTQSTLLKAEEFGHGEVSMHVKLMRAIRMNLLKPLKANGSGNGEGSLVTKVHMTIKMILLEHLINKVTVRGRLIKIEKSLGSSVPNDHRLSLGKRTAV